MRALVVGGAGGMGRWFAEWFERRGWEVGVNDPAFDNSVPLSRVDEFDVVLIGVPINVTVEVIEDVAPRVTDGLLMDITSVKSRPVGAMMENTDESVEVLGTHPMFGPSTSSMEGKKVVLVRAREGELSRKVESELRNAGAEIEYTTADEHDTMMGVVQGLTHFVYLTIGKTFESLDFDVEKSKRFMSPTYEITLNLVGRALDQNPELSADIQMYQNVEDIHSTFIESAQEISDKVAKKDRGAFLDDVEKAAKHYGDTRSARLRSDRLIEELTN